MVCNPVIDWLDITTTSGVNISCYTPIFEDGITNPLSSIVGFIIGLLVQLAITVAAVVLALCNIITDPNATIGLGGASEVLQFLLDSIHAVIPPIALAALGFGITVLRATAPRAAEGGGVFGWLIPESVSERTKKVMFRQSGFDYTRPDEVKTFTKALAQGLIVAGIIMLLSMNPARLLAQAVSAMSSLGSSIMDTDATGTEFAATIIEDLVYIVNFPSGQIESCHEGWISAMQTGNEDFIAGACEGGVPHAGVQATIMAVFFLVVIVALIYYMFKMFMRGTLFLLILVWDFVLLPYSLAWEMFKPEFGAGGSRQWYDKLMETIFEFATYLMYFLIIVFLLTSGPTLMLATFQDTQMHGVLVYILLSAMLFGAGYYADRIGPSAEVRGNRPENLQSLFSKETIERSWFNNVYVRDDVTGKRHINWQQLGDNIKESKPGQDVRGMLAGGTEEDRMSISNKDKKRREDQEKILSEAFGIPAANLTGMQRLMYTNPEKHLGQVQNLKAENNRKFRNNEISADQWQARDNELSDREEQLRKLAELKTKQEVDSIASEGSKDLVRIPEDVKGSFDAKEVWATQDQIDQARELKKMNIFADYIGGGVTGEQLMAWENVDSEIESKQSRLEYLDKAYEEGALTRQDYDEMREKTQQELDVLRKVKHAKDVYNTQQIAVSDLVKDPITGKWVTQDQQRESQRLKKIAESADLDVKKVAQWLDKDNEFARIENDRRKLELKKAQGLVEDEGKWNKQMKALVTERQAIEKTGKALQDQEALVAAFDTDEYRDKQSHGVRMQDYAYQQSTGMGAKAAADQLNSLKESRAQLRENIEKGLKAKNPDIRAVDKLRRELRHKDHEFDKLQSKIQDAKQYLKSGAGFSVIRNPAHREDDIASDPYLYVAPYIDLDETSDDNVNYVTATAQNSMYSAQAKVRETAEGLTSVLDDFREALNDPDQVEARAEHFEKAHIATGSLLEMFKDTMGDTDSYEELARSYQKSDQLVAEAMNTQDPEQLMKALVNTSAMYSAASEALISDRARIEAEKASKEATEAAISELQGRGIEVTMPSAIEVKNMDAEQLRNLSQEHLNSYTNAITEAIKPDMLQALSAATPDPQIYTMFMPSETQSYREEIYGADKRTRVLAGTGFDDSDAEGTTVQATAGEDLINVTVPTSNEAKQRTHKDQTSASDAATGSSYAMATDSTDTVPLTMTETDSGIVFTSDAVRISSPRIEDPR